MKSKILVIDDEAAILHALQIFLEQEGYDVEATTNYNNYLSELDTRQFPSLIILDILLGDEDGQEIAKKLKTDPKTKEIPIVMISAHPQGGVMSTQAGADAFLAKPFDVDELLTTINRLSLV